MASVKEYVQSVVNAIGEVNTTLTQINAQDVPNKIRELKVEVGSKQLLGTYDGSAVEVTEAGVLDIGAMIDEGKLPLEVNVNVASGGNDMLQAMVDTQGTCRYLIYMYQGSNVDFIKNLDTSNVSDFYYMFYYCSNITEIPLLDTSNATDMYGMFERCSKLLTIPMLNTSKVTRTSSMFNGCSKITEIPLLDTSNVTDFSAMFMNCSSLLEVPLLDMTSAKESANMFKSCSSLTEIPPLNTSKVTNMYSMFNGCSALETIHSVDMQSIYSQSGINGTFTNCTNLKNLTLYNIKYPLQIGSGTTWGHLLTKDSLINIVKELIKWGSYTLTMGSANLEKIANVYVKFTDSTQTTIANNTKGDVVVCESTDEGAMLLSDYALLKNWTLA